MNMTETLAGLWRRWYIVVPGLVLACAMAFGAWVVVKPSYERTATELLIPSSGSFAPNTGNPFLNLAGLNAAADVLVGSLSADDVAGKLMREHPSTKIVVARDLANSGPALLYTVTGDDDAELGRVLQVLVAQTGVILNRLQNDESIPSEFRMRAIPITFDTQGMIDQKGRATTTVLVGVGFAVFTILLAAIVDGLSRRRTVAPTSPVRPRRRWRAPQL